MIVLIPISDKQRIDSRVLHGLQLQSVPCIQLSCIAAGVENSQGIQSLGRIAGEIRSRTLQVQQSINCTDEYILSMDRDIVLTDPNATHEMIDCLWQNKDLGAVALWFGQGMKTTVWLPHVHLKCVLFRREVLARIDFDKTDVRGCTCNAVKCQIEEQGFKIRYLDFVNRGKEISYTN
jgi:hypothetical protein